MWSTSVEDPAMRQPSPMSTEYSHYQLLPACTAQLYALEQASTTTLPPIPIPIPQTLPAVLPSVTLYHQAVEVTTAYNITVRNKDGK